MKLQEWEKEMLALTIAYRMAECHEVVPILTRGTRWELMDDVLQDMFNHDLIAPTQDQQRWTLDVKGRSLLSRVCAMVDAGLNFEIFESYNFSATIQDDWWNKEGTQLQNHIWDVRFDPNGTGQKEDLRIAMMTWMGEKLVREGKSTTALDPRKVVYLRHLANGVYSDDTALFLRPSTIAERFQDVADIARSAYRWQDLADDPDAAFSIASTIYTAGMLELRKEEGVSCGGCGSPLALFKVDKKCPICEADFTPPKPEGDVFDCGKCGKQVGENDARCRCCGARLDFSLPEGTMVTKTSQETVIDYELYFDTAPRGAYYGYVPQGWYDPWNPVLNAAAFGVLMVPVFL
jgi:hypothetical protein